MNKGHMESWNGLSNSPPTFTGTPLLLPPKSTSEDECFSNSIAEFEGIRRHGHQRAFSDSKLNEDIPFWLKELLDEPETPPCRRRTHRRSSSDSLAYLQSRRNEHQTQQTSYVTFPSSVESDTFRKQNLPNPQHSLLHHPCSRSDPSATRTNSKRAKRYSAQQYRARKVQYITELERSVQGLQVEGYEVSAEIEFLDQQNLILGMENRALQQRLESISQEQFIKCLEQEMLEKELTRLRNLYQQQQQKQQQKHYGRPRFKRQDLDSSFAKLSLKNKGAELQKAR